MRDTECTSSLNDPLDRKWLVIAVIALLIVARFVAGATLPLFYGDEPYYWLWSRHLAWGYFDHPPAIAWLVRIGTALFGDTEFGVRAVPLLLSVPISLCVWRAGSLLLGHERHGARAALFFNLTLMATVQTLLATPDAPAIACSAAFVWALAELAVSRNGAWWLVAGLFGGLGLLSKYTVLFVGAGGALWMLSVKDARSWLATPWPFMGAAIAALVFAPNLIWNANHGWGTFAFQFGRVGQSRHGWWFLPQFLAEQILLMSPLLFVLGARGTWLEIRSLDAKRLLIAACILPAIVYFTLHAVNDRVHRNWISIVYPALALAAADAFRQRDTRQRDTRQWDTRQRDTRQRDTRQWNVRQWSDAGLLRSAAVPVAAALVVAAYAQVFVQFVPIGAIDPLNQHLASNERDLVVPILGALGLAGARAVVTTDWPTTAWLRFYLPMSVPVIQANEGFRFPDAPEATASDLAGTLLYVTLKSDLVTLFTARFSEIAPLNVVVPPGATVPKTPFRFYRLSGFHGEPFGRIP